METLRVEHVAIEDGASPLEQHQQFVIGHEASPGADSAGPLTERKHTTAAATNPLDLVVLAPSITRCCAADAISMGYGPKLRCDCQGKAQEQARRAALMRLV
jgi:hypothetical protein